MKLLLILLLSALAAALQAQDFTCTTYNDTITITRYIGPGGAVTIPDTINDLPVTSIGISAFYYCTNVTSVTIPNSITSIGMYAFSSCVNLTDINIPNSVTSIEYAAFRYCDSLTGITIPVSVSSIGSCAFYSCASLTAITVDASNPLYSSVDGVLFNRHQTVLIQYPGGRAGGYAVPAGVTSIGTYAFASCTDLTGVTLPASVISIRDLAFFFSTNLANVAIPDGVTSIGNYAFASCAGLTNATIGAGVTSVGPYAFSSCAKLTGVTMPASVTNIGPCAFSACASLAAITVPALNPSYSSTNGVLFNKNQSSLIQYPGGRAGSYMVPNGVTNIGSYAFAYCGSPNSVTLSDTVTNIETYAFASCAGLTNIAIGNGLTTIVDWTFPDCTNLARISMGGSVTNISKEAFRSCTNLTGLYFHGNAPSLGHPALFSNAANATVYYLPATTGWGTTFGGRPTALWQPQVLTSDVSFGVRTNQFGFNVTWATGRTVAVEACTNLAEPVWSPLQTNTLTSGSCYFSDPAWTNYPGRFYRLRAP